jgi:small subunit ribosomal protein S5
MEEKKEVVKTEVKAENAQTGAPKGNKPPFNKNGKGDRAPRNNDREKDGFDKKTISIRRVVKVTKGGKIANFSAMIVAGDKNGKVGVGTGKALETPNAIDKATASAKKHLVNVNLAGGTIPHAVVGKFGASIVYLFPAKEGTGVIAGGSARSVLELVGVKNISCKSYGSRTKNNMVLATLNGLMQLRTREQIAALRGKNGDDL